MTLFGGAAVRAAIPGPVIIMPVVTQEGTEPKCNTVSLTRASAESAGNSGPITTPPHEDCVCAFVMENSIPCCGPSSTENGCPGKSAYVKNGIGGFFPATPQ